MTNWVRSGVLTGELVESRKKDNRVKEHECELWHEKVDAFVLKRDES